MYSAQLLRENIKDYAKKKNISVGKMLEECRLGINAISQISDKRGISVFSIAKIADYMDCSVDYLLGRTNVDEINKNQ